MEAMTQEFMLHRRPHVEIWSAREGSDDDTNKIHRRHKPPTDPTQCQQRTTDPPQKSDGSQQTMVNLRYHKTERKNQTINHYRATPQKPKSDKAQTHHMSTWSTSESPDAASATNGWQHLTHIWRPKQDMNQTQVFFPGSDYTSYQE